MTMLVHLLDSNSVRSVSRSGLRGEEFEIRTATAAITINRAVFAMPVLPNFYATHQWLRELKRRGIRTISAAYFKMRSDALVYVGHYNEEHRLVPLGHAAGLIMHASDPRGWQIIIPQAVPATSIHKIADVPQVIGWRYFPESHTKGPWKCTCEFCLRGLRGEIKSQKLRQALARGDRDKPA